MDDEEYADNNQNGNDSNVLVFRLNRRRTRGAARFLSEERHAALLTGLDVSPKKVARWRMRDRMKTVSVALVYALNIGVDPPDVVKPEPCARMECWIDPLALPAQKALESIGKALQAQYERWQPRARYKSSLDPTVDEVKKLCQSLRRNAKDERILLHYNGHGVPRPTSNGEIWVFNKNYTQYIPLSIYELQSWMGSPSIYVLDCSAAGLIVNWFLQFVEQRDKQLHDAAGSSDGRLAGGSPPSAPPLQIRDFILLAACGANELLPTMNPELPADVFSACLTTPIKMALRWFCSQSFLSKGRGLSPDLMDKIPGRLTDRRTPLGELNWIFTAITDTIAWNLLPRELFQKLFRQDLLVASLFRNYLLAERIMRSYNCTTLSFPRLPPTHQHSMWHAWDLVVDICIAQLPEMIADSTVEYKHSSFFAEQLTAFEVWLEFGSESKKPPEQLPIVLQVLLSQVHRLRALLLLGKFLDLGPWAVNLALSVGIFPYVLKLLQSPAAELRQILVFIWTKILALDKSCQVDLVKDNGYGYFISILANSGSDAPTTTTPSSAQQQQQLATGGSAPFDHQQQQQPQPRPAAAAAGGAGVGSSSSSVPADQRQMAAFVLASIVNNCRPGQSACLSGNMLPVCLAHLNDPDPGLRKWLVLYLAKCWESYEDAKWAAIREGLHDRLCQLLTDPDAQVRTAAVYALGTFIGGGGGSADGRSEEQQLQQQRQQFEEEEEEEQRTHIELNLGLLLPLLTEDASPLVRTELLVTLSRFLRCYERQFSQVALEAKAEEEERRIREEREQQQQQQRKKPAPSASAVGASGGLKSPIKSSTGAMQQQQSTPDPIRHRSRATTPEPVFTSSATAADPSASASSLQQLLLTPSPPSPLSSPNSIFRCLWDIIVALRADPYPSIARTADSLLHGVYEKLAAAAAPPLAAPSLAAAAAPRTPTAAGGSAAAGGGGGGGLASLARKAGLKLRNSTSSGTPAAAEHPRPAAAAPGSSPPPSSASLDTQAPLLVSAPAPRGRPRAGQPQQPPTVSTTLSAAAPSAAAASGGAPALVLTAGPSGSIGGSLHLVSSGTGSLKKLSVMDFSKLPDGTRTAAAGGDESAARDESQSSLLMSNAAAQQQHQPGAPTASFEDLQLLSNFFDWSSDLFNKPVVACNLDDDEDIDERGGGLLAGAAAGGGMGGIELRWLHQRNAAIKAEAKLLRRAESFPEMYDPNTPPSLIHPEVVDLKHSSNATQQPPLNHVAYTAAASNRAQQQRGAGGAAAGGGGPGMAGMQPGGTPPRSQSGTSSGTMPGTPLSSDGPPTPTSAVSSPLAGGGGGGSAAALLDSLPAMLTSAMSSPMLLSRGHPSSSSSALGLQPHQPPKIRITKVDEQVAILDNSPERPGSLLLHPFSPLLVVADDRDGITVWEREAGSKLHHFYNRSSLDNAFSARTTATTFVNSDDSDDSQQLLLLLLTASEDGVVRIWRDFDEPDKTSLVSAWRALKMPAASAAAASAAAAGGAGGRAGVVVDWHQKSGHLMTSGDVGMIRVWDLQRELRVQDIATGSDSCVSTLTHTKDGSRLLVAGCGDGSVRLFDPRAPGRSSAVGTFHEHRKEWIVKVHSPKGSNKLISGSLSGSIKFWDIRKGASFRTLNHSNMTMTAMAVHDFAPLVACGSPNQKIKVYDLHGEQLSLIRYHDGFLGQRIGPVSCLSFHPYLALLAAGAQDGIVSLYTRNRS